MAADDSTLRAHVLHRCTFGPSAERLAQLADATPREVIDDLLAAPSTVDTRPPDVADESDDAYGRAIDWWLDIMRSPAAGLHERMVWFWHGHLTSGLEKCEPAPMVKQNALLRRHALGNFRTLLQEITVDPAMLFWLDGAESSAAAPNENYARELMELFALGRDAGAYTEADVRNGARALAGWWVEHDEGAGLDRITAEFDHDLALRSSVTFLGRRVRTAAEVVDAVVDHPACAPYVAGELHEFFVGRPPDETRRTELAAVFRDNDMEIRPVVASILTDPSFLATPTGRPRSPLDWYLALERLTGERLDPWVLEELGQTPMNPPNVAGWPDPQRWLSGGAVIGKSQLALDLSWDTETLGDGDPVGEIIRRAALPGVSPTTRTALDRIAAADLGRRERSSLLHATVAMCPEFNLA